TLLSLVTSLAKTQAHGLRSFPLPGGRSHLLRQSRRTDDSGSGAAPLRPDLRCSGACAAYSLRPAVAGPEPVDLGVEYRADEHGEGGDVEPEQQGDGRRERPVHGDGREP